MANLPPSPFQFAASDAAVDKAAASTSQPLVPDAAATPSDSGAHTVSALDEPATSLRQEDVAVEFVDLDQKCFIGEIFVGARKLDQLPGIFDPAAITGSDELLYVTLKLMDDPHERDLPDVPQGLIDVMEPMPLFLQAAGF